jgi:myo-inositol-1(or 4)-monophosphatase
MAAGQIMIREDGDVVSGIDGHDNSLTTKNVVCGNEFVHGELVKTFKTLGEAPPAAFDRLL